MIVKDARIEYRNVFVLRDDGEWHLTYMSKLQPGEHFRLWEGEYLVGEYEAVLRPVKSSPAEGEDGIWAIACLEI